MIKYPPYVPEWYDPKISYAIMKKYGDKSKELENYLNFGIYKKEGDYDGT